MSKFVRIQRKRDHIIYTIEGEWDPVQYNNIVRKVPQLDSEYLVLYKEFEYKPPVRDT